LEDSEDETDNTESSEEEEQSEPEKWYKCASIYIVPTRLFAEGRVFLCRAHLLMNIFLS
jgi:hypothetical protein